MKHKKQYQTKSPNYFSFKNPFFIYAIISIIALLVYFFVYKPNNISLTDSRKQISHAQTPSTAVPVGTIIYWPNSTVPTGFLECNGQSTSGYPELAAVVGGNVPDLKGQFVRSWNSGRGVSQTLDSGRGILTTQTDLFRSHTHSYNTPQWVTGPYFQVGGYNIVGVPSTTGATGGSETRPSNVALMAIIKY